IPILLGASYFKSGIDAQFSDTTMNVAWGTLTKIPAGTYTVARLTISNDAAGSIVGRVGGTGDSPTSTEPLNPRYFGSAVPLPAAQGVISGRLYWDRDLQGSGQALSGTAYLDINNNGSQDAGEPTASTVGSAAIYTFVNLAAGTYTVRQVPIGAFHISAPASGAY